MEKQFFNSRLFTDLAKREPDAIIEKFISAERAIKNDLFHIIHCKLGAYSYDSNYGNSLLENDLDRDITKKNKGRKIVQIEKQLNQLISKELKGRISKSKVKVYAEKGFLYEARNTNLNEYVFATKIRMYLVYIWFTTSDK